MNLFQQLAPLVSSGVVMRLAIRMHGDNMQLDIIPEVEHGKTGISVPAQALIGSAVELDERVSDFLAGYVASAANLNEQIAVAKAVMEKALEDAKDAVKSAASKVKPATAASSKSSGKPAEPKADKTAAGFMDMEDDADPSTDGDAEAKTPDTADDGSNPVEAQTSNVGADQTTNLFI